MNRSKSLFAALLCLACIGAQAQWQWIDKDGRKVFSDRGPGPEILPKNILKQPGGMVRSSAVVAPVPASAASDPAATLAQSAPAADAPKLSAVDKDLAERKKQAEALVSAKAKADDERVAKAKAENCERARGNKSLMESGVRVSQTNTQGERVVLDDAARAAEVKRAQVVIDASCR